jgi:HNH endonuclease
MSRIVDDAVAFALEKTGGDKKKALALFKRKINAATGKERTPIGAEELRSKISYNPLTGEFRWIKVLHKRKKGEIAGCKNIHTGYWYIHICGSNWLAHRLAWLYMTGEQPPKYIDHKNGQPDDNRWENLRAATQSQNIASGRFLNKKSGLPRGVFFRKDRPTPYRAQIRCGDKEIYIGAFNTVEEAASAYTAKSRELFGEFAAA